MAQTWNSFHFQIVILLAILILKPSIMRGQIIEIDLPTELTDCAKSDNRTEDPNLIFTTTEDIHIHCIQRYIWKSDNVGWGGFNVTDQNKDYINSLIESFFHRGRSKRQAFRGGRISYPPSGFRIRREYRRLTDQERFAFHAAINQLKMSGQYDILANLHQGMTSVSAHGGPNFFGWHRIYIAIVEEAIRRIDPRLSLPYWDSTMDFDMDNPVNSIIWTAPFLGNGDGFVTSGPFSGWNTPAGRLIRNIGGGSRLFSKADVRAIMSRCRMHEISDPSALPQFNLELAHGGPHIWVGGLMSGLNTAAHDPVFFLHHAFVDYLWELFRIRQARFCAINPSRDYPLTMGPHGAQRPMDGLPQYRNIDGYRSYWTQFWYRYERSPTCSFWRPFCGTPYLRCDMERQRCISVIGITAAPPAAIGGFSLGGNGGNFESFFRARAEESSVNIGPRFRAPPPEIRTQDAKLGKSRVRRETNQTEEILSNSTEVAFEVTKPPLTQTTYWYTPGKANGNTFNHASEEQFMEGIVGNDHLPFQEPLADFEPIILPSTHFIGINVNDMLRPPIQNTFFINGQVNITQWAYIPLRVIFTPIQSQEISRQKDKFFSSPEFPFTQDNEPSRSIDCIQEPSGAIQIRLESTGLNYYGSYTEFAVIDKNLPMSSSITFIGIKSPVEGHTDVLLTGYHSCGLMCQPHCYRPDIIPRVYEPCGGALRIFSNDSSLYGVTYAEAVNKAWKGNQLHDYLSPNLHVAMHCTKHDKSPWIIKRTLNYTSV